MQTVGGTAFLGLRGFFWGGEGESGTESASYPARSQALGHGGGREKRAKAIQSPLAVKSPGKKGERAFGEGKEPTPSLCLLPLLPQGLPPDARKRKLEASLSPPPRLGGFYKRQREPCGSEERWTGGGVSETRQAVGAGEIGRQPLHSPLDKGL